MKNLSFIKKLRNERHAHYMLEFLEGMPRGVYEQKRPALTQLIGKEVENLRNCRKNHTREQWNEKVNELRTVMAALGHLLKKEAELGRQGGAIEKHSYDTRVKNTDNNHDFVEAVRSFLAAWSGVESNGAEALVDDARAICEETDNLVSFMEMEDLMIANIPVQESLRKPTDDLVMSIIKKAEVEQYELSPDIESEVERLELINEFLGFAKNWIKRITVSVKNSRGDEEPTPEPEIEPLMTVQLKRVDTDSTEEQRAREQFIDDSDFETILDEDPPVDPEIDGIYEIYP